MAFKQIDFSAYEKSPFQVIGQEWMLITMNNGDKVNTMTASWGGLGVIWGSPAAFVFIRPQRFSKPLMDAEESFSLCVLDADRRADLNYLGTVSGRDEDKVQKTGLTTLYDGATPYFAESNTVFICSKRFAQPLDLDAFTVDGIRETMYPDNDAHTMYIAKIEKILIRE